MAKRKNPAAVALGRRTSAKKATSSAKNATKARAALSKLSDEQRSELARKAVQARWAKRR